MTKSFLSLVAIVLSVLVLSGCSQNLAKFSVASTGNAPLASNIEKGEVVQGKSCITRVFGIPFGNRNSKALEVATKKNQPADALQNVDIRASS